MKRTVKRIVSMTTALLVGITSLLMEFPIIQAKEDKNLISSKEQKVTEFQRMLNNREGYKIPNVVDGINEKEAVQLENIKTRSSVAEAHGSQKGYLNQTDDSQLYHISGVESGILLQARLKQPSDENIDYDLYILDAEGYILTGSENYTYLNENGTCPESVGIINDQSEAQDYYLYVHSSAGGSSSEAYTIEYAISYPYDTSEPDDNISGVQNSYEIKTQKEEIDSRNISNPVDTDWYVVTVPEVRNYDELQFTVNTTSSNGCKLEIYDDINGNYQLRERSVSADETISVQTGKYYVRVSYNKENLDSFSSDDVENYKLTINPILLPVLPDRIEITEYYCSDVNAGYVSYPQGYYYRAVGSIRIKGHAVATDAETGVEYGVGNTSVTIRLYNTAYDPIEKPQFYCREVTGDTDDKGDFDITLSFAPCKESIAYKASRTIHYYDMILMVASSTEDSSVNTIDYLYQLGRIGPI